MIPIKFNENKNSELPTLPFITKDDMGMIRLYYENDSNNIRTIDLQQGNETYEEYETIEEVFENFNNGERVVDAEIIIKNID